MKRIMCALAGAVVAAAFCASAALAADGGLYPCKPAPGHPGADPKDETRLPWGWPERLPYAGSVEHVRTMNQKYLPVPPLQDADSLVKNFLAWQLPGVDAARVADFAEPVYYLPMYGSAKATGEHMPSAKVVRWKAGDAPFLLDLGRLKPSYYVVRVIAAIDTADVRPSPKPMTMQFRINDGADNAVSTSVRRFRAVDNFYSVAEWYFRAWDDRDFRAELSLVTGAEVGLLVHNIDLHDHFAHLARKLGKKGPTLFTLDQRAADRAEFAAKGATAEYAEAFQRSQGQRPPLRPHRPAPPTPEARAELDQQIWNGLPPMNAQFNNAYGKMNVATAEEIAAAKAAGVTDPGWGVYFPKTENYWTPVADKITRNSIAYQYKITPMDGSYPAGPAVLRYHFAGDAEAARDMAMYLVRIAYLSPTWDMRHSIQNVVSTPEQCWGREQSLRRRTPPAWCYRPTMLMEDYDMLYDFIAGNDEFARAVNRFIPGVRTPDDVLRFLDTNILQYNGGLIYNYRIYSDHESPLMMLTCATVQGDREITEPWMQWLFTRTWDYPQPLSGIPDQLNTATSRDGTTYIGSWFYTAGGGRGMDLAVLLKRYIAAGGDPKYDLVDFERFPKIITSCFWPIVGRVAGLYPMQIGDVNGATVSHGHWFDSGEQGSRLGWKWTKDPRCAYALKNIFGRKGESDEEWAAVEKVAADQRNPWFANASRALSQWAGVLEGGAGSDDFRFRRAVTIRVGNGWGHAHNDTLDMSIFAAGCVMAADGGQRPGYGHPECATTYTHNLVEVDGDGHHRGPGQWRGHGWIRTLADAPDAHFLLAESAPPANHENVSLFRRHVALIDVDGGKPSATPISREMMLPGASLPRDIVNPSSYIFDVFRVAGGKMHTYCFHGGQNDELITNARNVKPVAMPGKDDTDFERAYLRKFDVFPERKWAGDGVDDFTATWRLSRENTPFQYNGKTYSSQGGAEPAGLGRSYDPNSPRKFTRLHLLGHPNARVLAGTWVSAPTGHTSGNLFDCIFVQERGEQPREDVFAAIIEPYAGEPSVASARLLDVAGAGSGARRPVAVEVKIAAKPEVGREARTDVCFADAAGGPVRNVGDLAMSGEFALVARDAKGLTQAMLVGGSQLAGPGFSLALAMPAYEAAVTKVDYLSRVATLDRALPPRILDGSFFEVGDNATRTTSLAVNKVDGAELHFPKGVECVTTRVLSVDEEKGAVRTGLSVPILGLEVNREQQPMPGWDKNFVASNDDRTKFFRCDFVGGTRSDGYDYKLTGGPARKADFPEMSTFRVYEFGVGHKVRLAAFASLRRIGDGLYELRANAPVTLRLGGTVSISRDGKTWTMAQGMATAVANPPAAIGYADLGDGTVYVRAK